MYTSKDEFFVQDILNVFRKYTMQCKRNIYSAICIMKRFYVQKLLPLQRKFSKKIKNEND